MPRKARRLLVVPHHPHHVILRGNNRRCLFSYPHEYRFFLKKVRYASFQVGVPVHSLMQMRNHVHLIATPADHRALSAFVGSFAQQYAQYRNKARGSSGKLFEERFKCVPILSDEHMAVTTAYVELNPVRAEMCADPQDYPWSTFSIHAATTGADPLVNRAWTPSAWYLSLADDPADRADAFTDWFEHYRARDDWASVQTDPKHQSDRKRFERPNRRQAI